MKKIKQIIYEDAPKQTDSGLLVTVSILVGEEAENNVEYRGKFPFKTVVPYDTPCNNVGSSIIEIQEVVRQNCQNYLNTFVDGLPQ